jgi:hypothetical protein
MKKELGCLTLAALFCGIAFVSCQMENKADVDAMEALFSEEYVQSHADLEEGVRAVVEEAKAAITGGVTWEEVRPDTGVEACCWANSVTGDLAPDDEGGVNTYNDNCPPSAAVDGQNGTWWNINYMRSASSPTLNKRHTNKNTNDGGNHWITLDLGGVYNISGFGYMGRNGNGNSRINAYQVYVSEEQDLGRDPENSDTGDHPGHRPPPSKLVHQGNFGNSQDMQRVTFAMPAYGRYVQLRVFSAHNDGTDGGAAELRVIREAAASGSSLTDAVNAGVSAALAVNGYAALSIDDSYLAAAYAEGIRVLGSVKNNPAKFKKLDTLLHGGSGVDGAVIKGAREYLNDDPDRPPETLTAESDVNVFFDYQEKVDALTGNIHLLLSAL